MSFVKLIEFSDKKIREEFGDYYIISKDRVENIRNNFDSLREDKHKLQDALRELAEAAEWRDECRIMHCEMYRNWLCNDEIIDPRNWMESICDVFEAAESSYQAALKAVKEIR